MAVPKRHPWHIEGLDFCNHPDVEATPSMTRLADFARAESQARNAERAILTGKDQDAALVATINAVELYMKALRLADDPVDRRRVDAKCKELLVRAERLKSSDGIGVPHQSWSSSRANPIGNLEQHVTEPKSTRKLTRRENIIILEGSKLNGFLFRPWDAAPSSADFNLQDGEPLFEDSPELPLSPCQLDSFAGWMRPKDALGCIEITHDGKLLSNAPTMGRVGTIDLVQDMTTDCSVVASLCAGTSRAERGHPKILRTIVYPYDHVSDEPALSQSGKYVLRLNFNGCWRRVDIDDKLPTSTNSRVLHVINRSHPGLLWPALVEKAYLKVRGGYDFPGSNSGTDLAVLTGWIPQQIFLHDEEVEPDGLWNKVHTGFKKGDLLLTMGTGKLPEREQRLLGLAAEHDYAVLDMKESNGLKEMLIKNPWSNGDVWRGAARRRPNPSHESIPEMKGAKQDVPQDHTVSMLPGTFWMDFNSVFQHFENLYVNWNPGLFAERHDVHFSWHLSTANRVPGLFVDNPQFTVSASTGGEVWLLLNKHLKTGDYLHEREGRNGYISLYIYDKQGAKVISRDAARLRGPFVDSPNTLLIFNLPARSVYTAVVVSQDLPLEKHNFTLSAFAETSISLAEAESRYGHELVIPAAWTRSTAGGNSDKTSYLINPQFSITAQVDHDVALVLRIDSSVDERQTDIHVKILIVSSDGRRITRLRPRDIVAHSGDYQRGSAVIETHLSNGKYGIICSTFDRDQYAKFNLTLHTSSKQAASLRLLPSEGSGRLSIDTAPAVFEPETSRLLAPVTISKVTRAIFILRNALSSIIPVSSLFRMTLEQGQGPYKKTIASSAFTETDFSSVSAGVRIEDIDLLPAVHGHGSSGLWLVLERCIQTSSEQRNDEVLKVELLADEQMQVGPWGYGDG